MCYALDVNKVTMVDSLEQMLGGGGPAWTPGLLPPKRDFRKICVMMRCSVNAGHESECTHYRPGSTGSCSFQDTQFNINTCLNVGVV